MTVRKTEEGVVYTHMYLWKCAEKTMRLIQTEAKGAYYFRMQAALMMYLSFEAYINYLGERVDPESWKDEKSFFSQLAYRGIEGKIKRIAERVSFPWENGKRPYQTIKELSKFRNMMAHGKPHKYSESKDFASEEDADEADIFKSPWDVYISMEMLEKYEKDISLFCNTLRICSLPLLTDDSDICNFHVKCFEPFSGCLRSGFGTQETLRERHQMPPPQNEG